MNLAIEHFQRVKNRLTWFINKVTAKKRTLPKCLIIGAQKAGTSSLYHYLVQHPQIKQGFCKEVHYFDGGINEKTDTFNKGVNWYRAHFPLEKNMKDDDICIDATPMYLFNPLAPKRIKSLLPDAKLIILLRNPAERAISHYFHVKRHGFEPLNIENALANEERRLDHIKSSNNYKHPDFRLFSYKERGIYLEQIKRYQALFNKSQILILHSDNLFQQPKATLRQIFNFLMIDTEVKIGDLKSQNIGNNKTKVSTDVYEQLQTYFKEANNELFNHIGEKFDW